MKLKLTLPLFALLAVGAAKAQNQQGLGINFAGQVFKIDLVTGTGVLVGSSGLSGTNCMARENDHWDTIDNTGRLYQINPTTGASSLVYQLQLGGNTDVRGFAIDTNLKTYVVVNNATSDELWTFDPVTGIGSLIGPMGSTTIQGLAVAFNGRLFAYDTSTTNTGGLKLVDPNTGATTDLAPNAPGTPDIQDIAPRGTGLIGARNSLFSVSTGNGFETLVGTGGYTDLRGLAVRQNPLQFNTIAVKLGKLDTGNVTSLMRREGQVAQFSKFLVPNQQVDPINVEATFATATDPAELRAIGAYWVGKMNTTGTFLLTLEILNVATNTFEILAAGTVATTTTEVLGSVSAPVTNYFSGNKVVLRFRIKPTGPVTSNNWATQVDMFRCEQISSF